MDAEQETLANPFGMDADCERCPALCETRSRVVHGYGDVGASFVVVGPSPGPGADRTGTPFTGDEAGERMLSILARLGFTDADPTSTEPALDDVYLTHLARCHHPERAATDDEVRNCEGYLDAELRHINPEVIVPVGQQVLAALAYEYTTRSPDAFDIREAHATTIRGRGFELVPMRPPSEQSAAETTAFLEHFADLLERDYRQTKGQRER
ncbi:MAG: uracil-DNA glycosylase family protein [Halorientalis sp.]